MKKIHKHLKSETDFVARPFAMRDHEHPEYIPGDQKTGVVEVSTNLVFTGSISGIANERPAITAGEVLSALRIIAVDNDGYGYYADPADQESTRRILGMTLEAHGSGQLAQLLREGRHQDPAWSFDVTKRLFLGANGIITQVAPATGISVVLGHVQTPDTIFLNIEKPIILI
jgi:hypothetical protein